MAVVGAPAAMAVVMAMAAGTAASAATAAVAVEGVARVRHRLDSWDMASCPQTRTSAKDKAQANARTLHRRRERAIQHSMHLQGSIHTHPPRAARLGVAAAHASSQVDFEIDSTCRTWQHPLPESVPKAKSKLAVLTKCARKPARRCSSVRSDGGTVYGLLMPLLLVGCTHEDTHARA